MKWLKRAKTPTIKNRAACEVCGFLTLDADHKGMYDMCPVCFWEDDSIDDDHQKNPDEPCYGPNHGLTLNQAKKNFRTFGACSQDMVPHTRKPLPEETPALADSSISPKQQEEFDELKQQLEIAKAAMPKDIRETHTHTVKHREEILASKECGCFYCGAIFMPNKIEEWVDDNDCALCPECGIDSVIGDKSGYPITKGFMSEMHKHWFD